MVSKRYRGGKGKESDVLRGEEMELLVIYPVPRRGETRSHGICENSDLLKDLREQVTKADTPEGRLRKLLGR